MTTQDWRQHPWLRKLAFLGGNLAAAAVMVLGSLLPIQEFFSERDLRIARQQALLSRLQSIASQETDIQAAARNLAEETKRGEFIVGPNEGVINADLQTKLKMKVQQSGARLRSAQSLPSKSVEGIRYAGVRLDLAGTLQAIYRTIYAIERGKPYHFITEATIKPSPAAIVRGVPTEPSIEARLDIFVAVEINGHGQ